jgi:hypothetical protein
MGSAGRVLSKWKKAKMFKGIQNYKLIKMQEKLVNIT